jgi:hypothetical protein
MKRVAPGGAPPHQHRAAALCGATGDGCRVGVFSVAQRNSGVGALLRVEFVSRAWV